MIAGLADASVAGPLAFPRGETVVVASSFGQAKIVFNHALAFLKERYDLSDRLRWRVQDSANLASIENREIGASVKCIGSDPKRAHGLAPTLVIADEPAQWETSTSESMLAALTTAAGKQPESWIISLGTRPSDESHWFANWLIGGADYAQTHAARENDPPFQRRTWARANPSLDAMPDLEAAIRREAVRAKLDDTVLAAFRALRLNLGTDDVARSVLLNVDVWKRIVGVAPPDGKPVWGIDLGTSSAQSAVASYWPESGRLEAVAAFPTEPSLAERGLQDGVGRLYSECERRGELIQTGGAAVDISELLSEALGRFGVPTAIAADRWREAELRDALKAAGVPLARLELRGMGYRDGAEDVRGFQRYCLETKVTPVESLLLASAIAEARTVGDPAGNHKLAKNTQGGRRARARDDAAAAAILAVSIAVRQPKRRRGVYLGAV